MRNERRDPRLPPELVLHIFEHSRKPALIACSLVSRDWRKLSLPYCFHDVTLRCDQPVELPQNSLDENGSERGRLEDEGRAREGVKLSLEKNLATFLRFLRNTREVPRCIRKLTIDMNSKSTIGEVDYMDRATFLDIIHLLPNLRMLVLNDLFVQNWRSEPLFDHALDRLTVRYSSFRGGGAGEIETIELLQMLAMFKNIKHLALERFSFDSTPDIMPFPQRLGVTRLDLKRVWAISPFLESLRLGDSLRAPEKEGLRELTIQDIRQEDLLEMNWCLDVIGPNLKHFGFCIPFEIRSQFDTVLNLELCRNLKTLTMYLKMCDPNYISWVHNANGQAWDYLGRILAGLPFRNSSLVLDVLTLSIGFVDKSEPLSVLRAHPEIARAESLLVEFVNRGVLKRVRVVLVRHWFEDIALRERSIPEIFPKLHAKAVLSY